jgi:hypothetical protein
MPFYNEIMIKKMARKVAISRLKGWYVGGLVPCILDPEWTEYSARACGVNATQLRVKTYALNGKGKTTTH